MEVTVEDVMHLASTQNCKIVAGKQGIGKSVRWFLGLLSPVVGPWVHGHEILFLYGNGVETSDSSLLFLLDQCADKEISALFFIIGPIFTHIPEAVKQRADEVNIPIIEMPNEVPIVDITKEIADLIMYSRRIRNEKGNILKSIIQGHEGELKKQQKALGSMGCTKLVTEPHNIICIEIVSRARELVPEMDSNMEQSLFTAFGEILYYVDGENRIVMLAANKRKDVQALGEKTVRFREMFKNLSSCQVEGIGIGTISEGLKGIPYSFQTAQKAIQLCREKRLPFQSYDDMRCMEKLMFEIRSEEVLYECYKGNIGILLSYDEQHGAELLHTLEVFLACDGNIAKASRELFIHRNTMTYRINKINMLLNCKIEQAGSMQELSIAFICYKRNIVQG